MLFNVPIVKNLIFNMAHVVKNLIIKVEYYIVMTNYNEPLPVQVNDMPY